MISEILEKHFPPGTKSQLITTSLGTLHEVSRGQGRQVVLVHGNPTWSFLWRKVMAALPADIFETLAPDLMNLGFSDDLAGERFRLENHVRYMTEYFRKRLRPGAILVVQDWGGPIGLLAASECPELFSGFVILNTGVAAPELPIRLSRFHKLSNTPVLAEFVFGVLGFPLRSLHSVQLDKRSIRGETARMYRRPIGWHRRLSALKYARMVPSSETHPSYALFQRLENFCTSLKNVEIVWGIDDPILGRLAKRVRKILPTAAFQEVRAGHFLQEEVPSQIADAIERVNRKI